LGQKVTKVPYQQDCVKKIKPGTLSRYILWEDTSLKSAIKKYKNRFKL